MKQQSRASCGGAVVAGIAVLALLAAEGTAFALLAYRHLSWPWITRGWDTAVWLTSLIPYAHIAGLFVAGYVAFRILSCTFGCFAALAEPENDLGFVGWLGGVFGTALLVVAALAIWFPERWLPGAEAWASPHPWLKPVVPWLPSYLLLCTAASLHCFRLMGDDRHRLRSGARPRPSTHFWEFLGGWPGSLVGLMVFRHKATSIVYLVGFVLVVGLHLGALAWGLHLLASAGGSP